MCYCQSEMDNSCYVVGIVPGSLDLHKKDYWLLTAFLNRASQLGYTTIYPSHAYCPLKTICLTSTSNTSKEAFKRNTLRLRTVI